MAKSKAKKHKMTHPTLDWDENTGGLKAVPEAKDYSVDYTDNSAKGKSFGSRITVNAFHQMLTNTVKTQQDQKGAGLRFVEFSKASIFRVLSQPGCEYIRFYFVYPEKNNLSLVMEGLDSGLMPVKYESHVLKMAAGAKARAAEEEDPDYEEKGNGRSVGAASATETLSSKAMPARKTSAKAAKAGDRALLTALLKAINTREDE